ncbi:MAG TPA: J domain-containing protein [Polyangiales bacterium]|nr:J domain-containing protein [Polyangiales bacterium]
MTPQLSTALCSITPTQRRRYFWAAWWTGQPSHAPFRKPDASHGGARSFEEALLEAESVAGRTLSIIEPYWARAWKSVLRGQDPGPPPSAAGARRAERLRPEPEAPVSAWSVLGLSAGASMTALKRAYQKRALETHPDQGGDPDAFRAVQRAYEKLLKRLDARSAQPKRRS